MDPKTIVERYPLTEAAQDVPGTHRDMQEFRDEQARRLYRHACRMEHDRARLIEALRAAVSELDRVEYDSVTRCIRADAYALLREIREDA